MTFSRIALPPCERNSRSCVCSRCESGTGECVSILVWVCCQVARPRNRWHSARRKSNSARSLDRCSRLRLGCPLQNLKNLRQRSVLFLVLLRFLSRHLLHLLDRLLKWSNDLLLQRISQLRH